MWFDGGCGPRNPGGTGTYGVVIKNGDTPLCELKGVVEDGLPCTNNWAEYTALYEGIKWIKQNFSNPPMIQVYGDSNMVINMVKKAWGYHKGRYMPHKDKPHLANMLSKVHKEIEGLMIMFDWIPREQNSRADELSEEALVDFNKSKGKKTFEPKNIALELDMFLRKTIGMKNLVGSDDIDKENEAIFKFEGVYDDKDWVITIKSNK